METFDVLVIGAGPAGCSAATVLAEHGRRVALLEKEAFPRYRVGESLIPYCWFPLDRLGLVEKLDNSAFIVHKHSVQFASVDGRISIPFYFHEHDDHPSSRTWQVTRSEFDQLLLDNAVEKGAKLFERTAAKELLERDGRIVGVRAEDADGRSFLLEACITIDASGRDLFTQKRNRWRVPDEKLQKIAIWTYYEGAMRDPGVDEGATTIAYIPEKGWFWYLPQANDLVSVGIVADSDYLYRDTRDPREIFEREIKAQPWIERHLAPGTPTGRFRVTHDFSYRSRYCAMDGLVLAGDAFAFLDPVFSSGVFFALNGGILAGDAVEAALAANDTSAERFTEYGERICRGIEAMRRLVHAFYDRTFNFGQFMKANPQFHGDVTDCLIGNLERDFSALFAAMSADADIPEPLTHGRPYTAEDRSTAL